MRYPKLSITLNAACLAAWIALTVLCITLNTIVGYILGAVFFALSLYGGYYVYRILWLYNWGKPLSEAKKQKRERYRQQMHDYQRFNLYHRWYLFADTSEEQYQAKKAQKALKKIHR
jgi:hypothetical protein